MQKKLLTLTSLMLWAIVSIAQDNYVVAFGKLKVEWGDTDNTNITLYEDNKEIDSYRPEKNGKFQFTLELNHMYMFWFTKPGHVTKKVQFNTTVPQAVTSNPEFIPFPDFDFYVTLFKSYPEVDTMFFTKPVGKIQYDAKKNDFDWDKNYTLEIQRNMEEIEKDIRDKHEKKLKDDEDKQKRAEQQAIATKEAEKEAKRQANIEKENNAKEAKAIEEARKHADIEAKKELEIKKEQERLAQIDQEQQQVEDEAKNTVKNNPDQEDELQVEQIKESLPETNTAYENQNKEKPITELQTVPSLVSSTIDAPTTNSKKPVQKVTYGKVRTSKIDKVEVAGKTTIKTKITENNVTLIYVKVEYTWGGKFFFIEDEPGQFINISEQYYNRKVNNK